MKEKHLNPTITNGFAALFCLGLLDATRGVVWPAVSHTFSVPIGNLWDLLMAAMSGYAALGFCSGPITRTFGLGTVFKASAAIFAIGLAMFAAASTWGILTCSALLTGAGSGLLDAGVNQYAASSFSARCTNWLHAVYAMGAMVSPWLIITIYRFGGSWRAVYASLSVGPIALLLSSFKAIPGGLSQFKEAGPAHLTSVACLDTLRRPSVWLSVALFFLATGMEGATGQWSYALLPNRFPRSCCLSRILLDEFHDWPNRDRLSCKQTST